MNRFRVGVWVAVLAAQCWLLYTPDPGDGTSVLAPLWALTRPWPVPSAPGEPGFDTLVHAGTFALVTATGVWAGLGWWVALGVPLVHAPLSEVVQWAFIPGRTGDPRDVAADITGILVAGALLALWRSRRRGTHGDAPGDRGQGEHPARTVPQARGARARRRLGP